MTWPEFRRALRAVRAIEGQRRAMRLCDLALAFGATQSTENLNALDELVDELTE